MIFAVRRLVNFFKVTTYYILLAYESDVTLCVRVRVCVCVYVVLCACCECVVFAAHAGVCVLCEARVCDVSPSQITLYLYS